MRRILTRGLLVLVVVTSPLSKLRAQAILLGALEDVPGAYVGEPNSFQVRVTFQKIGNDWQAFPTDCLDESCEATVASQYPREVAWTIGFDGRILGKVTAQTPSDFGLLSHVGFQEITSGQAPTIGKRSEKYSGWLSIPVYRPLVANSQPYFKDPDAWKPATLSPGAVRALRAAFREKFPTVKNCRNPDKNIARHWSYRDEDIKITNTCSSNKAWSVASVKLEPWRCDGPADDAFDNQLFAISPKQELLFLGQGLWLVDTGDYDNDGRSELLFSISGYDLGGYELFYDDFKKHASFQFGYH